LRLPHQTLLGRRVCGTRRRGLSAAADAETVRNALQLRQKKLGLECFAEAYIDGREFNIALLAAGGVIALPPAEILF
jgi:D-alanine-D-alanine ligase